MGTRTVVEVEVALIWQVLIHYDAGCTLEVVELLVASEV